MFIDFTVTTGETAGNSDSDSEDSDKPAILTKEDIYLASNYQAPLIEPNSTIHKPVSNLQQCVTSQENFTIDTTSVSNKPDVVSSVAMQHRTLFPQGI